MFNFPLAKLGDISAITITTPDLETSFSWWQKLGFSEVMRMDFPFPWIQISDGALLIMLRKDNDPYIALTYYINQIDPLIEYLKSLKVNFIYEPKPNDILRRYIFQTPDHFTISLVNVTEGFSQPPGPTMLSMPQSDYFSPEKYINKTIGLFGEFAHPVANLDNSILFWQQLGFTELSKMNTPYPWAILSDGLSIVGLHQTQSFSWPAITYFASDMQEKIERLKQQGIDSFIEKMGPANVVLTTPEKQHVNLFKLGM